MELCYGTHFTKAWYIGTVNILQQLFMGHIYQNAVQCFGRHCPKLVWSLHVGAQSINL